MSSIRQFCTFKGAVCRILTLLKHKNTIICLQTFRKHVKLTYLFIWKTMLQSVILLWKFAVRPGMSVFVMVCETRPLPVYPIVFRHPGLPVAGKHSVFNLIHCHVRSFLLVSLIWHPAHASNLRRRGWWKNHHQYFEFGLQYLVQPLGVNHTYSTFKCWKYVSICTFRCWKYVSIVRFSACKNGSKCTFYRITFYVKYIRIIMRSRWLISTAVFNIHNKKKCFLSSKSVY